MTPKRTLADPPHVAGPARHGGAASAPGTERHAAEQLALAANPGWTLAEVSQTRAAPAAAEAGIPDLDTLRRTGAEHTGANQTGQPTPERPADSASPVIAVRLQAVNVPHLRRTVLIRNGMIVGQTT